MCFTQLKHTLTLEEKLDGKKSQDSNTEDKLDIKKILPVFAIVLVDLLGLTIIIPLLPLYAASYGANAFVIGALGAAYPIMQFVGAPILGGYQTAVGRRPVLILAKLVLSLAFYSWGWQTLYGCCLFHALLTAFQVQTLLQLRQSSVITPMKKPAPKVSVLSGQHSVWVSLLAL